MLWCVGYNAMTDTTGTALADAVDLQAVCDELPICLKDFVSKILSLPIYPPQCFVSRLELDSAVQFSTVLEFSTVLDV